MNLHQIANAAVRAVNPNTRVTVRVSCGYVENGDGTVTPRYETPGEFVGTISGTTLTVDAVARGRVAVGQTLMDRSGAITPRTIVTAALSPNEFSVNIPQQVAAELMLAELRLFAQVQPVTWRDLQVLDGLNIEGVRWKAYLRGEVNGIVRGEKKGGDLLEIPPGNIHHGTWLIAQVLEQFPDWVAAAITLQNRPGRSEEI